MVARWGRGWAGQGRWWVREWGDENGGEFTLIGKWRNVV